MTALAIALTLLNIFDGWTTYRVLKLGGREQNALVKWAIDKWGAYRALLVLKGGAIALVWLLAAMPGDIPRFLMLALAVFYAIVAAHNYNALCKLRGE